MLLYVSRLSRRRRKWSRRIQEAYRRLRACDKNETTAVKPFPSKCPRSRRRKFRRSRIIWPSRLYGAGPRNGGTNETPIIYTSELFIKLAKKDGNNGDNGLTYGRREPRTCRTLMHERTSVPSYRRAATPRVVLADCSAVQRGLAIMLTRADFLRVSFGREEREKWPCAPKSSRPRKPPRVSLLAAAHAGERLKLQQAPRRIRILLSYIFRLPARDSRRIIATGEHADCAVSDFRFLRVARDADGRERMKGNHDCVAFVFRYNCPASTVADKPREQSCPNERRRTGAAIIGATWLQSRIISFDAQKDLRLF